MTKKVRTYDYIRGTNKYFPIIPLPSYLHLTITTDTESECKYVTAYSKIHVNKEVRLSSTYSLDYSDQEILKDNALDIFQMYLRGLTVEVSYSVFF